MEERTRLVGGSFRISSALGEGTTVQVQVPLGTEAAAIH
jgi:signal transduction histidine kinase